jgi:hypothetical protein
MTRILMIAALALGLCRATPIVCFADATSSPAP